MVSYNNTAVTSLSGNESFGDKGSLGDIFDNSSLTDVKKSAFVVPSGFKNTVGTSAVSTINTPKPSKQNITAVNIPASGNGLALAPGLVAASVPPQVNPKPASSGTPWNPSGSIKEFLSQDQINEFDKQAYDLNKEENPWYTDGATLSGIADLGGLALSLANYSNMKKMQNIQIAALQQNKEFNAENQARRNTAIDNINRVPGLPVQQSAFVNTGVA